MVQLFLESAWKVVLAGVVIGAGLPALFAFGVREMSTGGDARGGATAGRRALGAAAFAVVVLAVGLGLTIIVATGFGKVVSFEHVVPTMVDKE